MSESPSRYGVLVGVDGSEHSLQAVEWAAGEAVRRGRPLSVCHVYPYADTGPGTLALPVADADLRTETHRLVQAAVEHARAAAPGLRATGDVAFGPPAAKLIELAAHADLLVLGARGHGGFASLLLGSVSDQVAGHAPGPVVVVRGSLQRTVNGPIVVGIDDSDGDQHALEYSLELASRTGQRVVAIYAYDWPVTLATYGAGPIGPVQQEIEHDAREWLEQAVGQWAEKYPDVVVERRLVLRPAAEALVDASRTAAIVAVGSRGRSGFAALVLGSVSRTLLHHAHCPVVVAR